jgi:peptidoglycan/xylan/chitin deacetylase (PgdA/CDA1 family)
MNSGGQGEHGFAWPNGARMAVVVTCLLETWSEGKWPPFSVQTTSLRPGTPDLAAAMWGRYGVQAGVWRLLKVLGDNQIPATFAANARALELDPRAAAQIVRSGHEIAAHSYTQDTIMAYLTAEEERAVVRKTVQAIEAVCGQRPKGWISPVLAFSEHTHSIVAEEGFLWNGDHNNIDLPFCIAVGGRTIVALPHSDFADHRVLRANPRDWYEVYKDTFDYLYRNESTSYLNVTVHCHFGGRPLMAAQIDRILKYVRGHPGVWLVRHDELAQWVLDNNIRQWSNAGRLLPEAPARG